MNEPLVTVIIPCWGEYLKYLPRCLDSVSKQTYKNIEVIVTKGKNPPEACNKAWKKAKGKYIAFLGADDTWHPDKIKTQVKVMEEMTQCVLCTCWSEDNRFNSKRISKATRFAVHKTILEAFNYSSGSTYMIRKEPMMLYDESLPSGQEYDLALRLTGYTRGYAYCIPAVLVKQFSTPGQISTNWYKKIKGIWQLAKKHGKEYDWFDWVKVTGLLGLYLSAYILGAKVYKIINYVKELYE